MSARTETSRSGNRPTASPGGRVSACLPPCADDKARLLLSSAGHLMQLAMLRTAWLESSKRKAKWADAQRRIHMSIDCSGVDCSGKRGAAA